MIRARIKFRSVGQLGNNVVVCKGMQLINPQYMKIGDLCWFGPGCRIEAWDHYNNTDYHPQIIIGRDVRINSTCHIGSINRIEIEEECLFGSHVMLMDHAHGSNLPEEMELHPSKRELFSKGGIHIGKRCWLCENVVVLPGVTIGEGCVIGANSVVVKDIPPYSVAAGIPAKVVKTIQQEG